MKESLHQKIAKSQSSQTLSERFLRLSKRSSQNFISSRRRRKLLLRQMYSSSAYESRSNKHHSKKHKKSRKLSKNRKKHKRGRKLELEINRYFRKTKVKRDKPMRVTVLKTVKAKKIVNKSHKKKDHRKLFGLPGAGGGGGSVVVAPNQGAGIANAQVVINSLGTPATIPYADGNSVPAYAPEDTSPKVIVTRMKLPSNLPYLI